MKSSLEWSLEPQFNMEIYRITLKKWSGSLKGSSNPARWNSKGVEVIYSAWTRSLACLENIVHKNSIELKENFIIMVIYLPDSIKQETISKSVLPATWYHADAIGYNICQEIGDNWVSENKSAILKVPSSIINNEFNFVINPNHPDFKLIRLIEEEPFLFDFRIVSGKK